MFHHKSITFFWVEAVPTDALIRTCNSRIGRVRRGEYRALIAICRKRFYFYATRPGQHGPP